MSNAKEKLNNLPTLASPRVKFHAWANFNNYAVLAKNEQENDIYIVDKDKPKNTTIPCPGVGTRLLVIKQLTSIFSC